MKAPAFWHDRDALAGRLLSPLGCLYAFATKIRLSRKGTKTGVPVICIGNIVAGGAGKTPFAMHVAQRLTAMGHHPHIVTRGYGGSAVGPILVDPEKHDFELVGDEPLLLAYVAPTWVSRDRLAGVRTAIENGADAIVLDDGFQDPSVVKDLSFIVIDGGAGFGNTRPIPAGPLREFPRQGMVRADALVMIGADETGILADIPAGMPVIQASFLPVGQSSNLTGQKVLAFAGIGRPEKFFTTLRHMGADVCRAVPFPDHHGFTDEELMALATEAENLGALPVTTTKDAARLPEWMKIKTAVVEVSLCVDNPGRLDDLLSSLFD